MEIVLIVIGSLLLIGLIFIFNRIARYRNNVKDAWSNIDVFLKKRYELVPVLVNTVKGYAKHEEATFLKVAEARSQAQNAQENKPSERESAENNLSNSIHNILLLQEAYPDLKANNSFLDLQKKLADIEQDLERSRRYYNATVRENNTFGESFPINLMGSTLGYHEYDFFTIRTHEKMVQPIDL